MFRSVPDVEMLSTNPFGCWNCVGTVGNPLVVIVVSLFEPLKMCRIWFPRNSGGVVLSIRYEPPDRLTKNVGLMTQSTFPEYVSFRELPPCLTQRLSNAVWLIVPSAFLSNVLVVIPRLATPPG